MESRKELLQMIMETEGHSYNSPQLIKWIVGDNLDLYQFLFELFDETAIDILDLPLTTLPDGVEWAKKAIFAHEQGISMEKICDACFSRGSWEVQIGKTSVRHRELRDAFEELLDHSDTQIRQIASCGYKMADDRMNSELQRERAREIYGYDEIRY